MSNLDWLDDYSWLYEGNITGARAERSGIIHAGVIHPLGHSTRYYSMSPLCPRYRKANGERLARHNRGEYPMLVASTRHSFGDYVSGQRPSLPLCRWCVAVWNRDHAGEGVAA